MTPKTFGQLIVGYYWPSRKAGLGMTDAVLNAVALALRCWLEVRQRRLGRAGEVVI